MGKERKRLELSVFDLPVHELRRGYRSAIYFWRTKRILELDDHHPVCTMQVFQKADGVILCGTDEAIGILKVASGYYKDPEKAYKLFDRYIALKFEIRETLFHQNYKSYLLHNRERVEILERLDHLWTNTFDRLEVKALFDGDPICSWETVMTIEGDYPSFAHLESVYLGVLARRTKIATNVRRVVEAARGKPVLFFADRFDHFATQGGDGYASHVGGAEGVPTDAMAAWYGDRGLGTMPHSLMASYHADTVLATEKFHKYIPDVPLISLVDFDNNCPETALKVARKMGEKLWAVRLDNAGDIVDFSLDPRGKEAPEHLRGVCPELVFKVREALDREGFQHVKIVVSGGFNPDRIRRFEEKGVPVDSYAVGSWILTGRYDFTADVVRVNGKNLAKVGREFKPNLKLELVK